MPRRRLKVKDFLRDFRSGRDFSALMAKYDLTQNDFAQLCRVLSQQKIVPLVELIELQKLSDSQEMRALREIETSLNEDE